tara:strand:+ start:5643 stop:6086 length:444 start_codon:yes stop_codon:yes gene_type:complete
MIVTDKKILRQVSKEWVNDSIHAKEELEDTIHQMQEAMKENKGVGISAIQIGVPERVFLAGSPPQVFINPKIKERSSYTKTDWEGCLSCPGAHVKVKRAHSIVLEFIDENYEPRLQKFIGFDARVIQHEFDHLNGFLIIDRGKVYQE